ncbi:MAG: MBL fold metallo-hydrolase [Acidobacteria bacterium]|nr:MBL fold metallo-hydrolase [Acidobacteriota bacterium]
MQITFHGAAREVTGSCHLVECGGTRILLDCGLIQGGRERHERNREPFPFDPATIDAVVLSHAHIDHSGRLPLLRKHGFRGPIVTTTPTARLLEIMLADSGRIQEEDARWKIKRLKKAREDTSWVTPLYTEEDALALLGQLVPVELGGTEALSEYAEVTFVPAGHILGAAIIDLTLREDGKTRRLVFSGDLGVQGSRLLPRPRIPDRPDYLIMESTYGDREREDEGDRTETLFRIVQDTVARKGKVIIPAFAVGRTQELLTRLNDLVEAGRLPGLRVYVDSPMAVAATKAFALHPEAYSQPVQELLASGDAPLQFAGLSLVTRVQDSMAINASQEPSVIISASGMCTAGRVKHHLKHTVGDARNTILFVGYQAAGSLGRLIQAGTSPIRIFGEWYPLNARVETIDGFSAHADRTELLDWFAGLGGAPDRTFLVHGEEQAALALAETITERFAATVTVPRLGERHALL